MLKKHAILLCILASLMLLIVATIYYPGGTNFDTNTIGFSWKKNYISNLFAEKAVNGMENGARYWAIVGMMFHSISFSIFFTQFSKRIPVNSAANVIKFFGIAGMVFTFLIATPLHDIMVMISSTIYLVCMFYITVFVFKSKLHLFKVFCTLYLLVFYSIMYIYGSGDFRPYLPIIQKVLFGSTILLILGLHYFTKKEDFQNGSLQRNLRNVE
ncbi:hypothetical protein WG904_08500 [Pedobacter sp. Du54]|uniref:hypothetical protein n=1 Tax=Pedobacter anseongensis TaxID=3133439 RepID=UPI00309B7D20